MIVARFKGEPEQTNASTETEGGKCKCGRCTRNDERSELVDGLLRPQLIRLVANLACEPYSSRRKTISNQRFFGETGSGIPTGSSGNRMRPSA